jgi:predicted acetyltransferase
MHFNHLKWLEALCTFRIRYKNVEEHFSIKDVPMQEGFCAFNDWLDSREKDHQTKSIKTDVKCRVIRRYHPG